MTLNKFNIFRQKMQVIVNRTGEFLADNNKIGWRNDGGDNIEIMASLYDPSYSEIMSISPEGDVTGKFYILFSDYQFRTAKNGQLSDIVVIDNELYEVKNVRQYRFINRPHKNFKAIVRKI